eukprot:495494-Prymnesium_polylepis.1
MRIVSRGFEAATSAFGFDLKEDRHEVSGRALRFRRRCHGAASFAARADPAPACRSHTVRRADRRK